MTAKYWTKDGEVMCRLSVKTVFEFKNLDTGEIVTLDNMHDIMDTGFKPVVMPKPKVKKATVKTVKSVGKSGSKYKGVKREGKKFSGSYWDSVNKKAKFLGMFKSELLAAAAVQEAKGNHEEAKRLRNEYEEGDPSLRPMEE